MALINRANKYHLYYLFANDTRRDPYDGLSHVAEHTLLFPTDSDLQIDGRGYTCTSHVCLYFGSDVLEVLQEVDRKIMHKDIITDDNVSCAKEQVLQEITRLQNKTARYEQLVSFVTENRMQKSVIGNLIDVARIQTDDVVRWFKEKEKHGQIFRFLFKDAHNMIFSTPIPDVCTFQRPYETICKNLQGADSFLWTVPAWNAKTIQIYFEIPVLLLPKNTIKKALYEFCIQRKVQDTLGIDICILDSFFDVDERFVLIEFSYNSEVVITDVIGMIRNEISSISLEEFRMYREEFILNCSQIVNWNKSNSEIINAVKNSIIYSIPQIAAEDINRIDRAELDIFPKEWIALRPLKVVIK